MRALAAACVFALLAGAAPSTAAPPQAEAKAASPSQSAGQPRFGPFDSGSKRPVTRQGKKGISRAPHPIVGDIGHIPGGGPPPPALKRDSELPEMATQTPNAAPGLSANPLYLASLVYAQFLTRMDGPRCQHLPTCSRFASQAVARYGPLGIPIGLDRVIQPGNSSAVRTLPELEYGGIFRHYDPLENYEFWHPERFTGFPVATPEEPLSTTTPAPTTTATTSPTSPTAPTSPTSQRVMTLSRAPLAPQTVQP